MPAHPVSSQQKQAVQQSYVRAQMRRLHRCLDFASRSSRLDKSRRNQRALAEIYQMLALAWEFLALQCRHLDGWRRAKDGTSVCRVCGTRRDAAEHWLLLPRSGRKVIGRMTRPTSRRTLSDRAAATVLKDELSFHGVRLQVEVLNPHRSRLFRGSEVNIMADRLVKVGESGAECSFDDFSVRLQLGKRARGAEPPFGALLSELPRRMLRELPVMVEYDRWNRLVGVIAFKVRKGKRDRTAGKVRTRRRGGRKRGR